MEFGSIPIDIDFEANAEEKFTDKKRNPNKFSFGKIPFINGYLEGFTYIGTNLTILVFLENANAKNRIMQSDDRRLKEIFALTNRMRYYKALSPQRRLDYLQKHGHSANYNNRRDTTTND